ncbi:MAG: caspase domain-containing protein [Planctomycetaceae bacterium]|jgi:hypothetical protein
MTGPCDSAGWCQRPARLLRRVSASWSNGGERTWHCRSPAGGGIRRWAGVALLWGVVSCVSGPVFAEGWALVIGVNSPARFRRPDGGPIRPLKGAEQDAQGMAALLGRQPGFHPDRVILLTGADATRDRVQQEWEGLVHRSRPGDHLVWHFSGHGTQVADRRPFDETTDQLDEALCLADSDEQGHNLLLDDDLSRWLDRRGPRDCLVILDCCHAGTGTKSDDEFLVRSLDSVSGLVPLPKGPSDPPWKELRPLEKGAHRREALFACQSGQQAYERRFPHLQNPDRGGQFTQAFLLAFSREGADRNADGRVTGEELRQFVNRRLHEEFNRLRDTHANRQEPEYDLESPEEPLFGPRLAR